MRKLNDFVNKKEKGTSGAIADCTPARTEVSHRHAPPKTESGTRERSRAHVSNIALGNVASAKKKGKGKKKGHAVQEKVHLHSMDREKRKTVHKIVPIPTPLAWVLCALDGDAASATVQDTAHRNLTDAEGGAAVFAVSEQDSSLLFSVIHSPRCSNPTRKIFFKSITSQVEEQGSSPSFRPRHANYTVRP